MYFIMKESIIKDLFKQMALIGNHKNMKGYEKKKWTLNRLKEKGIYKDDDINMMSEIIDYIIMVDNRQLVINQKNVKKYKCFGML